MPRAFDEDYQNRYYEDEPNLNVFDFLDNLDTSLQDDDDSDMFDEYDDLLDVE